MMTQSALLQLDSLTAAPRLLGWELLRREVDGSLTGGRIVEVEAYHGAEDPASHAYRGRSARNAPMYEASGVIYTYLSYGLHTCLNIVTGPSGQAQAVLIRALEPTRGLTTMAARRSTANPRLLASGPGRVGQALGLTVSMSGQRLEEVIELRPPPAAPSPADIWSGPRIGITRAADRPWRFWLANNDFVSARHTKL
ncbi:MAG TPA: DNA-3-methyladenine glycosylase [Candidatus Saccharimonadia bacterium]|nr:DNA-3-methyladenine glycosylase [Candidatus Saccharimonadia bacterium]